MRTGKPKNAQKPDVKNDVVVESRDTVPEIVEYLQNNISRLKPLRYVINDKFDAQETTQILSEDLPDGYNERNKARFINEIVRLCKFFFRIKKRKQVKIQLEIVTSNKCRLFHEDRYRQRLLCTYLGPGTEWLDETNVNREALGKGCNANIVKDVKKINRAKAFEVILLKGANYETEPSVVHRSPQIEKQKITRVLLKIDE